MLSPPLRAGASRPPRLPLPERGRAALVAAALLLAALSPPTRAHDMWLVPPVESPAPGEPVEVVVAVGMDFPASLNAIDPARVALMAHGPADARVVVELRPEEDDQHTVASFTPPTTGAWLVAGVTRPRVLELEAAKFNEYLLHDGLPHVLAGRMDRGELERDAVERYSKSVKTLVPVGASSGAEAAGRVLGHDLEIVLLDDPLAARPGDTLRARVLYRGAPLERANLCWDLPGNGEDFAGQTWTDAEGTALVPVARPGPMTLRLVHMTRPRTDAFEWESFWASFTFRVATP